MRWSFKTSYELTVPALVIGNSTVLATRDGVLHKVSYADGKKKWSLPLDSFVIRPISKLGDQLLVMTAKQSLYSINFDTGQTQWLQSFSADERLALRSKVETVKYEGSVYQGLTGGDLVRLDATSGLVNIRYNPFPTVKRFVGYRGQFGLHNGTLLLARFDGKVAGLDLKRSLNKNKPLAIRWQKDISGGITNAAYRSGTYYVSNRLGWIYALDAMSGELRWQKELGFAVSAMRPGERLVFVSGLGRPPWSRRGLGRATLARRLARRHCAGPFAVGEKLGVVSGSKTLYTYHRSVESTRLKKASRPAATTTAPESALRWVSSSRP